MTHPIPAALAVFSPGLAAGAAAAAVAAPLVIHLLFRKRYQVVPWAAVRFLAAAERRHHRRIEQWLLLAVRTLVILLPLLAMAAATDWAEPWWQSVRPGELETVAHAPRTHHVLVLDDSLSMTARATPTPPATRPRRASTGPGGWPRTSSAAAAPATASPCSPSAARPRWSCPGRPTTWRRWPRRSKR